MIHTSIEKATYNYTESLSGVDDYARCAYCSSQMGEAFEEVDNLQFCSESCIVEYAVQERLIERYFGTGATEEEIREGKL